MTHQSYKGRISYTTDCWTSPNHRAFLALLGYIEVGAQIWVFPVDVIEVPRNHTGKNLADEVNGTAEVDVDDKVKIVQTKRVVVAIKQLPIIV